MNRRSFRVFLKTAVAAYAKQLDAIQADPEKNEPWKTQGFQWHLSQKAIHGRHMIRWKPALLATLIGRFKSMQPDLAFSWSIRTAGRFSVPGEDQVAGKIVTNMGRGLRIELRAPKNTVTPAQIDRLGEDAEIKPQGDYDRVVFWVRSLGQVDSRQLLDLWRRCRKSGTEQRLQSA